MHLFADRRKRSNEMSNLMRHTIARQLVKQKPARRWKSLEEILAEIQILCQLISSVLPRAINVVAEPPAADEQGRAH